jgi:hypothetical protein
MGRVVHGVVVLERAGAEVARWPVGTGGVADLALVDAVARLQLVARRSGCELWLEGASDALAELVAFVGLEPVLLRSAGGKVRRQPEDLEQPRVEEVVVTDDPVA